MTERTHGLARKCMIESALNGTGGCDERKLLEISSIPVGIVIGKRDTGINSDFIKVSSGHYKNLELLVELDTNHATLWNDPQGYNSALSDFLARIRNKSKIN
jgi:pimeloyl-ACP methyl ester carboxylesterase